MSKITILDEQEPSVKSAYRAKAVQVGSWENMFSLKTGSIAATKVGSPGAKWVAFRLFSKLDRCHSWKLLRCITSSYILLHNLWSKQEDKIYIQLKVSFSYHRKSRFLNYNIFHKLLSNKEFLVVLGLLLYKFCKNNNETWLELRLFKKFLFEASKVRYFWDTTGCPELAIFVRWRYVFTWSFSLAYFFSILENNYN